MKPNISHASLSQAFCTFTRRSGRNIGSREIAGVFPGPISGLFICNAQRPPIAFKATRKTTYRIEMKRSASTSPTSKTSPKAKKPRSEVPEYHLTPSVQDESGNIIWPAPAAQIERARNFLLDASAKKKTLIVPDKDADGLTSGAILQKTLALLGLSPDLMAVHLLQKGSNIHDEKERAAMAAHKPAYIIVLDQGSRKSPPIIDGPHKALVIDHHWASGDDDFPEGAAHVTACHSPPIATSALLTYHICGALHDGVQRSCDWLCAMGTHGDLGNTLKWQPPFPDMKATFKAHTKKAINDAVSLINAPRRTATYDVPGAWAALTSAAAPADLLTNTSLLAARAEVNAEVLRCTRAAPRFSRDGKIAVFRISSAAQVHPVIATRWAGHLQSAKLEVVLVANEGYLPGRVNFSCRVPRSARAREPPVNIIEVLNGVAARAADPTLRERLGENFARGHREASGGIVETALFEEFVEVLEVGGKGKGEGKGEGEGEGGSSKKGKKAMKESAPTQSNTLMNYFGKEEAVEGKT
ncbi:DHH phosphoesterase [Hypoxylon fragiforme]|uniref:DHH phosphoesterase n=1 Tax=Hypoxylon fragiforme TaxID=63214 RepID=UPI0020C5B4B3|nr:DHH phosphoesterase [Hypoxylon fragiforme]KAI2607463.1 DHH phosphoesterase [Hypoxylon fragiforme]